ncbi:rCG45399 [Rattus norvegicus]|uniref:RCG45399 n=1 Tax=Rattus norvegicus TaxID=10116 RepID=A6JUI4_RAT|nr:rCG45399 [Rattus norvegicus]
MNVLRGTPIAEDKNCSSPYRG